ncbi:hypothetical protein F4802DRAFT_555691 [Xylaria palmicola]|nr:hypothetical protein F4802DRAFT_555691 [Xylaria palmicola]
MHPDEPRRQLSYCNEEPEESVVYENHADDSFCYQTRQLKQSALLATSEAIAAEAPSQHSQFDTTVSSTSDVASIFPNPDIQKSTSNLTHGRSNINNAEHRERADGAFITSNNKTSHPIPATRNPDSSLLQCHEGRSMSCGNIDSIVDTAHMPKFKVGRPLSDITLDECSFRLNISSTVPQTVAEVREAQVTRTESFLDDDPTLIGDQINTEKPADIESTQPILCHDSFVDSSLLQHYAISATNFANTTQLSQCSSVTTVNSENDSTTSATSIIPDAVVAELQPTVNNPAIRSAQGEVTNPVFGTDATLSQVVDGTLQSRATAQTIPIEHQSPWAVQSNSRSNGLAEYEPEESTAQPMATKFDSTPLMHCSPTIRPSQQSPWVMDIAEPLNIITLQGTPPVSTAVIMDIELSKNPQNSMLSTTPSQSTPLPPVLPALSKSRQTPRGDQCIETNTVVEKEGSMPKQILPCTPIPRIPRQSTPEGEVSIRSFSNFNLSSPQRSVHYHGSSRRQTFLSSRTYSNTPTTAKSNRRVSFAPLPHEEDGSNQGSMKSRAASPPPPKLVDPKEEDVDGNYQNHFDIMNRRLSIAGARGLQYHQRLLPSSSQQQPESPSIGAMAEAFQEADAYRLYHANSKVEGAKASEGEAEMVSADIPQSPWQHDSMGIDDVAAVLANLPEFLDVWDVDAEIDKNRVGHDKVKRLEASSNTDMSILQGVGIW